MKTAFVQIKVEGHINNENHKENPRLTSHKNRSSVTRITSTDNQHLSSMQTSEANETADINCQPSLFNFSSSLVINEGTIFKSVDLMSTARITRDIIELTGFTA